MPKPREPIELIQAKGKKHLTKGEIEARKSSELKIEPINENIIAPDYLDDNQTKEFYDIAKRLLEIGIMTDLDCDCISRYLVSKKSYIRVTEKINECVFTDIDYEKDLCDLQDKYFKQCRQAAADLGLTIASRCKLVMPKAPEAPKENKFKKFVK